MSLSLKQLLTGTVLALSLSSCGIQSIPQARNSVEAATAEVTNQYKRRSDLIPNLVETVKGYASHEQQTLTAVTEARAHASQITVDPTKLDPETMKKFQESQGQLSQALGRLMVVAEKYPDLKANTNFRDLQAQLEGTENRTTVARGRLIEAINVFNNLITVPPTSWTNSLFYHHEKLPQWSVSDAEKVKVEEAPKVNFSK